MTHFKVNSRPSEGWNSLAESIFNEFPGMFSKEWKYEVPVNITETNEGYILDVIAPGFEKSDFLVNLDQQLLTISAEKKAERTSENKVKSLRREYTTRAFKRTFTVDDKIDSGKIGANYVNGILTLNLPRKESVKTGAQEIVVK